ncbi:MAG: TolC family protein, partial [Flavobacteriales bacterium]
SEVQYYRDKGLDVARQLLRNANKSFKAGAIDYVEYVQFVDQAIKIRLKYLEALNNLNQSMIRLEYLMGG